jgi:hypothetical protein
MSKFGAMVLATCLAGLLMLAAASSAFYAKQQEVTTVTSDTPATPAKAFENGYYSIQSEPGAILSLRLDATGQGKYGDELVASGHKLLGVASFGSDGKRLVLDVSNGGLSWPLPFVRDGFYDADRHINYPDPESVEGATPSSLPVRTFVSSTGQTLFIEYFKRLPLGNHGLWLNMANGSRFGLVGDRGFGGHAALHCPGHNVLRYEIGEDFLRFKTDNGPSKVEMTLFSDEGEMVSSLGCVQPRIRFTPEFTVKNDLVDKTSEASPLATDLLQMAILWHPDAMLNGEWILDAVRTHWFDAAPSSYQAHLRQGLFRNLALIGYDRYEHFGMLFNWGPYPDYGAGDLLNVPENNGQYDMRMLHVNAMYIIAVAEYVMSTGDLRFLQARPARWIETDGEETQPICGGNAVTTDHVLAAGDRRLDGKPPKKTFYLGQTFTATKPFQKVTLRLGSPSTNGADFYENKPSTDAVIEVRDVASDKLLTTKTVSLAIRNGDQKMTVALDAQASPGRYEVRLSDPRSGVRYFGPAVGWWTDPEAQYDGGDALWGPTPGSLYDRLKTLFNYLYEYTGANDQNLSYYPNDPELNVPDQKSGRPKVTMQNSYHECLGGGYDAFMGLWWPPACKAMAQLAEIMNDQELVARGRSLHEAANDAYNRQYWHTVTENGQEFQRYYGCKDWDGVVHDYGFTYYNAEAAQFGIPKREQAWQIFRWFDRGFWKVEPNAPWQEDIFTPWQIAAPFNTIEIGDWVGITGKLPYCEVLSNGGTRLMYEARALSARNAYLSVDNAHERNMQVLARFASPDRLTGGRSVEEPGGRGRWHFGPPYVERADIEGYREIFPGNGSLATAQIALYLGATFEPRGLRLAPEVPSGLDSVSLDGIGFRGNNFDVVTRVERQNVPSDRASRDSDAGTWTFGATAPFNKVGLRIEAKDAKTPFRSGVKATLALEEISKTGEARVIAKDWRSHLRNGEWIWIRSRHTLEPGKTYRLRLEELAGSEARIASENDGSPSLSFERAILNIKRSASAETPPIQLEMQDGAKTELGSDGATVTLSSGEGVVILAPWLTSAHGPQAAAPIGTR